MIKKIVLDALFLLILFSEPGRAETMVLIPGFQSQGMDWRFNRVTPGLQASGWVDGGDYLMTAQGVVNQVQLPRRPHKVFYTLNLPFRANVHQQAVALNHYLQAIYQQRREPITLVGHSTGGVVARHWLVTNNSLPVNTLISIASPHLGTPLADLGQLLVHAEIRSFAEQMGFRQLTNAQGLFRDLRDEQPGRYLYWLNNQPHPAIRYVGIVRNGETPESMDFVVPKHSQDMNNVVALRGRAERWNSDEGHFLTAQDGYLLAYILTR